MKTLIHPNNQVLVNFPNLQSRTRNCAYTVDPEERREPVRLFKATADVFSPKNYAKLSRNIPVSEVQPSYRAFRYRRLFRNLLLALAFIMIGAGVAIYLAYTKN